MRQLQAPRLVNAPNVGQGLARKSVAIQRIDRRSQSSGLLFLLVNWILTGYTKAVMQR